MRIAAQLTLCAFVAVTAWAEDDIAHRLRILLPAKDAQSICDALDNKNFLDAESLLARSGQGIVPQSSEVWALRGDLDFLGGNMDGAIAAFRHAATFAPLQQSDRFTFAMAWVKVGNDEQARAVLDALLSDNPRQPLYLYWLGRLDYDQGRYQDAVDKLTRTTELAPDFGRAWDSLGLAFDMQGRVDEALNAFAKAVSLNRQQATRSPWPTHNLGYLLLRMNRLDAAETTLRESLGYDRDMAQTHLYLGRVLERQNREADAISEYALAVSLDKRSSDACYSLALLYRKSHRNRQAEEMFAEYRKRRQASTPVIAMSPESAVVRPEAEGDGQCCREIRDFTEPAEQPSPPNPTAAPSAVSKSPHT